MDPWAPEPYEGDVPEGGQAFGLRYPRWGSHTLDEWYVWEGLWELVRGEAYDRTPGESPHHQERVGSLLMDLALALERAFAEGGPCAKVLPGPLGVFILEDQSAFLPDLLVVGDPAKMAVRGIVGPPDLVVEVLSPRSRQRDLHFKREAYARIGVPEYLVVDPDLPEALLLRLEGGRHKEVARVPQDGIMPLLGGTLPVPLR